MTNDTPETTTNQKASPLAEGILVIKEYLKTAPSKPGVYRMIDPNSDVLYVGKAKHIKKRVTSYTRPAALNARLIKMVSRTAAMEFITTRTEAEALLLEASLIKRFKPLYNVLLKDDKSFPYILLSGDHNWPQITKHRGRRKQGGQYFGPFASTASVTRTLNTLQKVFQLRSCSDATLESRTRPCLLHQIKRCSAPCVGRITKPDYMDMVNEAQAFLNGKSSHIQQKFAHVMQEASDAMNYEQAALFRDRLKALTDIQSHQSLVNAMIDEADVIAAYEAGGQVAVQVFFFRAGQNWGHRSYFPRHQIDDDIAHVLGAFTAQFYDNKPAPKLVLLSHSIPDMVMLSDALSDRMERRVKIMVPIRGAKAATMAEAIRNAKEALERRVAETTSQQKLLAGVAELFDLETPPERIEIYDNSHIQGSDAVGGMVVVGPEGFMKNSYRKFNIRSTDITPGDDFGMMREVMKRRFTRLLKEDSDRERGHWPDLVLIDGGKGQLSVVTTILDEIGVSNVPLVAISKGPDRHAGREQFHISGQSPFTLPVRDPVLYYLQRLRDEAHRFAIGTHRAKRTKAIARSPLDTIGGIGAKRKKALLHHFGSAKAVAAADMRDLAAVEGISAALAQKIYDHFQDS